VFLSLGNCLPAFHRSSCSLTKECDELFGPPPQLEASERRHLTWLHTVLVLLGGWVALSPLLFQPGRRLELQLVVGAAIILIAGVYTLQLLLGKPVSFAAEWMIGLLELGVIATAMASGLGAGRIIWSGVIVGGLVTIIAGYVMYSTRST